MMMKLIVSTMFLLAALSGFCQPTQSGPGDPPPVNTFEDDCLNPGFGCGGGRLYASLENSAVAKQPTFDLNGNIGTGSAVFGGQKLVWRARNMMLMDLETNRAQRIIRTPKSMVIDEAVVWDGRVIARGFGLNGADRSQTVLIYDDRGALMNVVDPDAITAANSHLRQVLVADGEMVVHLWHADAGPFGTSNFHRGWLTDDPQPRLVWESSPIVAAGTDEAIAGRKAYTLTKQMGKLQLIDPLDRVIHEFEN